MLLKLSRLYSISKSSDQRSKELFDYLTAKIFDMDEYRDFPVLTLGRLQVRSPLFRRVPWF